MKNYTNTNYTLDGNGVPFGGQGAPRPRTCGSNGRPFGGQQMGILIRIVVVIVAIGLAYGGWLLKREINYSMDYKDKVIETVHTEVDTKFDELSKRITVLETEIKTLKAVK